MTFLRNTWYVAAWASELAEGMLLDRVILNEPIVLYRKADGNIAAIADRCSHRFAPLHLGKLENDCVQCPYHGLRYDSTGQCVHNPNVDGVVPRAARVKSYPSVEQHMALWIWMGDAELADIEKIPDYSFLYKAKPTARNTGYLWVEANYELLADNILDLSHVDFLHPDTLGGGALSRTKPQTTEIGDSIRILWEAKSEVAPPIFAAHLPDPLAPADLWKDVVWSAPSQMHLSTGTTPAGRSFDEGVCSEALHMMTPETDETTHYFFANTRTFRTEDADFNAHMDKLLVGVFRNEDKPMVEAQQAMMKTTDLWSLEPVLLPADTGAVRARRFLAHMIAAERAQLAVRTEGAK